MSSFGCCPCSNLHKAEKWRFLRAGHTVTVMVAILSAIFSILEFRVRSRASLELELIALRHQVTVVCTENSNSNILMMQPADQGMRHDATDPLSRTREYPCPISNSFSRPDNDQSVEQAKADGRNHEQIHRCDGRARHRTDFLRTGQRASKIGHKHFQ